MRRRWFGWVLLILAGGPSALLAQGVERGGALPGPLPLFPSNNWWNVDVSAAPVDSAKTTAFITNFIGGGQPLHPDFGGDADVPPSTDIYGMVYIVVPGTQPLEPVTFVEFGSQSDAGAPGRPPGYPIPIEARTQGKWIETGAPGGCTDEDCHMLIVDRDNRLLFELYHAHWNAVASRWEAGSGAAWSLDANARRPDTWTSADAAGLAILPGLVRYDEVYGPDPIRHAFRFTVNDTNGYVYPASHDAGSNSSAPPMGTRFRLKAGVNISGFDPAVQKIFQAMKTYGLIVADNGSDMYIQGTYDTRWDNDILNPAFGSLHASDFEVIQLGWKPAVTDLIFQDNLESAGIGAWSSASTDGGDLSASNQAALHGTGFGLEAVINDTNGLFVQNDTPTDENRYRARFYLDPNGFDPGEASGHLRVRVLLGFKESPQRRMITLVLRRSAGAYALMARVRLDDETTADTPFVGITDAPHSVEIDWKRSTDAEASDGSLQLWIDGTSAASLTGLNNSLRGVDFARLGVMNVKVGASGTVYLDEFVSRRTSYVGP